MSLKITSYFEELKLFPEIDKLDSSSEIHCCYFQVGDLKAVAYTGFRNNSEGNLECYVIHLFDSALLCYKGVTSGERGLRLCEAVSACILTVTLMKDIG